MKAKIFFLSFIISICFIKISAQPDFPENGEVFRDDVVPRVDIFINPDTLQWLYENPDSFEEFHADFIFNNENIIDTIYDIGFRLRGNTSRYAAKKSFKVSFNKFEPGRKYYGLEKMNLNGEHNDPSIIRSKISWDLFRKFEIPAPRSNHVELYINNNYYGLYVNVEHIDEEFVESRFGNKDGNLYKCLWPADLDYLGSNPDNYKFTVGERRAYDLKTNVEEDDYSDLANIITILNNTSNNDFRCDFESIFNIHDYLKVIAVDIFISNWDGYIYNKNNFYLYHNSETDKFEYIPYDTDNTLGIDWLGRDWPHRDIYDWQQHGDEVRPLYTRFIENSILKDQYSFYFNRLLQEFILISDFIDEIEAKRDMIAPYVINDPFYPLDYGYTIDDFYNSYYEYLGGHVAYGLIPYIDTRKYAALGQLELDNMDPIIKYIENGMVVPEQEFWARAYVEDESLDMVEIYFSTDGGAAQILQMFDDGNHHDRLADDMIFGGVINPLEFIDTFEYQIQATDTDGHSTLLPCEPNVFNYSPSEDYDLVINEFMAINETTIEDDFGEFEDWIEIYNNDSESVWIGDKYLSDNPNVPDKYQFPDLWLEPGDFLLVWADKDPEQGPLHANFKLSGDGEFVGIFDSEQTLYFPLDTLSFSEQNPDDSYGRIDDGFDDWTFFTESTPGYSNTTNTILDNATINKIRFYPNPVTDSYLYINLRTDISIYDSKGVLIDSFKNVNRIDISDIESGVYIVEFPGYYRERLIIL